MDVNVTGMLRACQSFYEPLVASGRGRIVNIASSEFLRGAGGGRRLRGIQRSGALADPQPGGGMGAARNLLSTRSRRESSRPTSTPPCSTARERGKELLLRTPMGRFGKTSELTGAAVLLASDAASFITGQCIVVDGGFLAFGRQSVRCSELPRIRGGDYSFLRRFSTQPGLFTCRPRPRPARPAGTASVITLPAPI